MAGRSAPSRRFWTALSGAASRLARIIDRVDQAGMHLAAAGLAAMSAIVFAEVVIRLTFTRSTLIADELASYLLAMLSFLALGHTLRTEGHIRVGLIFQQLPLHIRRWLDVGFTLLALLALFFFGKWLLDMVLHSYMRRIDSQSQLQTPLWIPQSMLVLGVVVLALALVARLIRLLRRELEP